MKELDYKTALELKEAGWPQLPGDVWYFVTRKSKANMDSKKRNGREAEWRFFYHRNPSSLKNEWYSVPRLSQLIEACWKLNHNFVLQTTSNLTEWGACTETDGDWYFAPTPKEAVARLWLASKKNHEAL